MFWRGDSGLDHTYKGKSVAGGWYDAGDNVKFNLPMAWTAGVMAWGVYEFKEVSVRWRGEGVLPGRRRRVRGATMLGPACQCSLPMQPANSACHCSLGGGRHGLRYPPHHHHHHRTTTPQLCAKYCCTRAQGFFKTGELAETLDNIKWATDYFLRCIIDANTIVGQVGNGECEAACGAACGAASSGSLALPGLLA